MKLRQFNDAGIEAFRVYLNACRLDPSLPPPLGLLEDDSLTQRIEPAIEMDPIHFDTKSEAAHYLTNRLAGLPERQLTTNIGLWSWLTLFYFDSVVPMKDAKRIVKGEYYYILDAHDSRYIYRHLLWVAWRVLLVSPIHNRLMLSTSASQLDKVSERVMSRLYLTRIPCFFEVLDRLYWDLARGRVKRGVANQKAPKPGDLTHRLPMRIRQLEPTYDLNSLSADHLLELLGSEFKPWLENADEAPGPSAVSAGDPQH